jgi:2-oxoisovalerate dehydrogenase E2 component (dihydrolipoyl transacylase)
VKPLASVQAFDLLCEVQSDKASVEITSPFDGIVKELLVQEGELAKVGEGLCLIETDEDIPANSAELAPVEPVALAADKPAELTSLEEILEPTEQEEGSHEEPVNTRRLHPLDPNYTPETVSTASSNVLATPSVRHFSRQKGVDLGKLAPGTGKGGRIERKDVEAYLASGTVGGETKVEDGKDVVVELGRTRYGMWKTMVKVRIVTSTMSIVFGELIMYTELGDPTFRVRFIWMSYILSKLTFPADTQQRWT